MWGIGLSPHNTLSLELLVLIRISTVAVLKSYLLIQIANYLGYGACGWNRTIITFKVLDLQSSVVNQYLHHMLTYREGFEPPSTRFGDESFSN